MNCIWLSIEAPDLAEIINGLSQKYGGPIFQPHCTLVGRTDIPLSKLKSAIINLVVNHQLSELHPLKINYTDSSWRALFIELKEKQILTKWYKYTCELLAIEEDTEYFPHISLMYNNLPNSEKKAISNNIQLRAVYKIRSVQIVECSENINNWNSVFELSI